MRLIIIISLLVANIILQHRALAIEPDVSKDYQILLSVIEKSNISQQFLVLEAAFIAEDDDANEDKEYSLNPLTKDDLNLNKDETIMFDRYQEKLLEDAQNLRRINKLMTINYHVQGAMDNQISHDEHENMHLPKKSLSQDDYINHAFIAAETGDINSLRVLLDNHVDINSYNKAGHSLLMQAVLANQIDSVRLLLAKGADFNLKDNNAMTPVDVAALHNYDNIMVSLLSMGASAADLADNHHINDEKQQFHDMTENHS